MNAPAGTAIEVFYSEKLGADGRASTVGNDLVFGQLQTDYYVAKGAGDERFTPRFSYKGFQYVQLSGPRGEPLPAGARVSVERIEQVRTGLAATGSFESAQRDAQPHPPQHRLGRAEQHARDHHGHAGLREERLDGRRRAHRRHRLAALRHRAALPEDVPGHARRADARRASCRSWRPSNQNYGYVGKPAFKPEACCGATPAWDAFWFVLPWESYRRHGDRDGARGELTPRCGSTSTSGSRAGPDKDGDAYAQTLTSGLGDWVPPEGVPTVNALVSTAYYARLAWIAADVARSLGKTEDADRYDEAVRRHQERLQRALPRQGRRLPREGSRPVRRDRADPAARVRARAGGAPRAGRGAARPTTS